MRIILFSILITVAGLSILLPDLWVHQKLSFFVAHDLEIPFHSSFWVLSNYYSGGVQLWNRFDQVNLSVTSLSFGLYNIPNVLTASLYVVISEWTDRTGEIFYRIYSISHLLWAIGIRTVGGYLLLRDLRFTRMTSIIALGYLNLALATPMTLGLGVSFLYAFLPLVMFFILRWFNQPDVKNFSFGMLSITLAMSQSPSIGLSYFYVVLHFFILASLIFFSKSLISVLRTQKYSFNRGKILTGLTWGGPCFLLSIAIMLPTLWFLPSLQEDFYIPGSGLAGTSGRLSHFFDVGFYFSRPDAHWAPFTNSLDRALDFKTNQWWINWPFLGLSTIFFTGAGLIMWRSRVKYILLVSILSILFLNSPREGADWWMILHWINVLTNPLSPLFRGAHMSGLLAVFLLLPLIAFGISTILKMFSGQLDEYQSKRLWKLPVLIIGLVGYGAIVSETDVKWYLITSGTLALLMIIMPMFLASRYRIPWNGRRNPARQVGLVFLAGLMLVDFLALKFYVQAEEYGLKKPIESLSIRPIDKTGNFNLAYQNPEVLPFRPYIRVHKEFLRSWGLHSGEQSMYGLYYRFTPLTRYLSEPTLYKATPLAYKGLYENGIYQHYLERNPKIFDFYPAAVRSEGEGLEGLIKRDADTAVISVDLARFANGSVEKNMVELNDLGPKRLLDLKAIRSTEVQEKSFALNFQAAEVEKQQLLVLYSFSLPKGFPIYLASDRLTAHRKEWDVRVHGQRLVAAQGDLVRPFTYDVNNVITGKLIVALPEDLVVKNDHVTLNVQMPPYISNVWLNENDKIGITFDAPSDGWARVHYPFSTKWQLFVDDKSTDYYRANDAFIAFPITKGSRKIELQYWPDTSLRFWIKISVLAMFGALIFLWFVAATPRPRARSNRRPF